MDEYPMHRAAMEGNLERVRQLIEERVSVNSRDDWGRTPLQRAAYHGRTQVVQVLLEKKGLDINPQDEDGYTPLYLACRWGYQEIVKQLLVAGADTTIRDTRKRTALHWAACHGHTQVVQVLLEIEGLGLNPQDEDGDTPMHGACRRGCQEIVKQLLVAGADTTIRDTHKRAALHWAASNGHTQVVQVLLEKKGLDINPQDKDGYTPLHWACMRGYQEIVKQLLVAGADINIRNNKGGTALGHLIRGQRIEEIRLFVQGGAFLQDCEYKQISENRILKENILNDVGLCTQSIVNKFHRQSLPALDSISYFARKLPNIDKFKLNARQIDEVENLVKWEINRNTFCNVVKAHPMALSALCVLSLITCQSGTKRSASPDFGDSNSPFKKLRV